MNPQVVASATISNKEFSRLEQTARPESAAPSPEAIDEQSQRLGQRLILAGFVVTVAGIVLYCAACFAGGSDADLGDILFRNAAPFAHATLAVLGAGTALWLVGSFIYLSGAIDLDGTPGSDGEAGAAAHGAGGRPNP